MRYTRLAFLVLLMAFALAVTASRAQAKTAIADPSILVPPGAAWKYLDNGTDQGVAWTSLAFDDSAWASGSAPLGYSDPVSTTVSFGPSSSNKYITTYFRHTFAVGNPTSYTTLTLRLRRDDGAVAYLNGVEVFRTNMPTGVITYTTLAASGIGEDYSFYSANFAASGLVAGNNALAVEVHQFSAGSSDIGFDAELLAYAPPISLPAPPLGVTRFAVIGDYGYDGQPEADVAALVKSWTPDFVVTTGDNNYDLGSASTIDANIGKHYHEFISPYTGGYGAGSATGNHDYYSTLQPYLDYFTLPGNERYYEVRKGAAHFFFLDTEDMVTNGAITTTQAIWLQNALALSSARWKMVVLHHPPYSSSSHGNTPLMQWPFKQWGATAVFAGHDHTYERFDIGGIPYFVDGLGGRSIYPLNAPVAGSQVRFNADYGAMLVEANDCAIMYAFYTRAGQLIDTYAQTAPCGRPSTRFAVIGDYGAWASGNPTYMNGEAAVANLITNTLKPDFVVTVGDNNYGTRPPQGAQPDTRGSAVYVDQNIGQFYHSFISPYSGGFGDGSLNGNRFFPGLGNADWFVPYITSSTAISVALAPHFAYFPWLNGQAYYSFSAPTAPGVVDIFQASTDSRDPNRLQVAAGAQRAWFTNGLMASGAAWRIAVVHYPPFTSENFTSTASYTGAVNLRLPYASWGVDAVISGDTHLYERVMVGVTETIPYFTNGAGGAGLAKFDAGYMPVPGSAARYDADFGAQLVEASPCHIQFNFYNTSGQVIDSYTKLRACDPVRPRAYLPATMRESGAGW